LEIFLIEKISQNFGVFNGDICEMAVECCVTAVEIDTLMEM